MLLGKFQPSFWLCVFSYLIGADCLNSPSKLSCTTPCFLLGTGLGWWCLSSGVSTSGWWCRNLSWDETGANDGLKSSLRVSLILWSRLQPHREWIQTTFSQGQAGVRPPGEEVNWLLAGKAGSDLQEGSAVLLSVLPSSLLSLSSFVRLSGCFLFV